MATSSRITLQELLYIYKLKNSGDGKNDQELIRLYQEISELIGSEDEDQLSDEEKNLLATTILHAIRIQKKNEKKMVSNFNYNTIFRV
jgi:hypothetical protein